MTKDQKERKAIAKFMGYEVKYHKLDDGKIVSALYLDNIRKDIFVSHEAAWDYCPNYVRYDELIPIIIKWRDKNALGESLAFCFLFIETKFNIIVNDEKSLRKGIVKLLTK